MLGLSSYYPFVCLPSHGAHVYISTHHCRQPQARHGWPLRICAASELYWTYILLHWNVVVVFCHWLIRQQLWVHGYLTGPKLDMRRYYISWTHTLWGHFKTWYWRPNAERAVWELNGDKGSLQTYSADLFVTKFINDATKLVTSLVNQFRRRRLGSHSYRWYNHWYGCFPGSIHWQTPDVMPWYSIYFVAGNDAVKTAHFIGCLSDFWSAGQKNFNAVQKLWYSRLHSTFVTIDGYHLNPTFGTVMIFLHP
jgi:hypothetical protein